MSQEVEAVTPRGERIVIEIKTPKLPPPTPLDIFRDRMATLISLITILVLLMAVLYIMTPILGQ